MDRSPTESSLSLPFFLIFASLISLIGYSIFGFIVLLQFGMSVLALFSLYYLIQIIRDRRITKMKSQEVQNEYAFSIRDFVTLLKRYYGINKKYSLMTMIGLILAIIIISQVFLVSATYQQASYDDFVKSKDNVALRMSVKEMDQHVSDAWGDLADKELQNWLGDDLSIGEYYIEGNAEFKLLMGHAYNVNWSRSEAHFIGLTTHQWNQDNYDFLQKLPSFEEFTFDESQSILILPPNLGFTSTDQSYSYDLADINQGSDDFEFSILMQNEIIYRQLNPLNFADFFNITYPTDAVYQLTNEDVSLILKNKVEFPIGIENGGFFASNEEIWAFIDELYTAAETFSQNPYIWGDLGYSTIVKIDQPRINQISTDEIRERLEKFVANVLYEHNKFIVTQSSYTNSAPSSSNVFAYSPLLEVLIDFQDGIKELQDTIFLFTNPLFLLSLFLLFFSLNLVEKRKTKIDSLFISKGMSDIQIKSMILGEIIITSTISILIGMGLSIISSENVFLNSNLLSSHQEFSLIVPDHWWYRIPILGFSLSMLFNLSAFHSVTKYQISESINIAELKKPIWDRWNLDLILFLISTTYWLVIFFVPINNNQTESLYGTFGVVMLAMSIISFPWVIARNFLIILQHILLYTKFKFDTLVLAVRNLRRNSNLTTRLISLIMTGFILLSMGITVSNTAVDLNSERALYNLGSEIVVENIDFYTYDTSVLFNLENVDSISNVHYVKYRPRFQDIAKGIDSNTLPELHFLGINTTTFAQTAHWKNYYSENSIHNLVQILEETPNGALMHSEYSKLINLEIGSMYNFSYGGFGAVSIELELAATFDYFPRLILEETLIDNSDTQSIISSNFMVVSLDTLNYLIQTNLNRVEETTMTYINVDSDSDYQQTVEDIYFTTKSFSVELDDIKDYKSERTAFFPHEENSQNALIQYEIDFLEISRIMIIIFIFLICVVSTSFYSIIFSDERRNEIGIYRALGIKNSQIFTLLLLELQLIVLVGAVFGILGGYALSYLTLIVVFNQDLNPIFPVKLLFEWPLILSLTIGVFAISIIVSMISIRKVSHMETGNILREL